MKILLAFLWLLALVSGSSAGTEFSCMDKCDGTVAAASICGGENVSSAYAKGLGTCAETKTEIFDKADYKGTAHMVPCHPHHCEEKCTAVGTVSGGTIQCFNISKVMYMSKADANDAALSRGCKGSHAMGSMFMPGAKHDGCIPGENYFDVAPHPPPPPTVNTTPPPPPPNATVVLDDDDPAAGLAGILMALVATTVNILLTL